MREKKYQVFVSSTYEDLKEERQAAVEAILSSNHIPAGMELFAAGDESQMEVIKRWIDESDIYMLLLGGRYGCVEQTSGKSYTQLEYEYALERRKPLFSIVISEKALDHKVHQLGKFAIETDASGSYREFKKLVTTKMVRFWDDKKDIKIAIHETLSNITNDRRELIGWIRGDRAIDTGVLAEELARLAKENSELRIRLENQNSDQGMYNGLTFEQLANMIETNPDSKGVTLYKKLLMVGEELYGIAYDGDDKKQLDQLVKYQILEYGDDYAAGFSTYRFTDMGNAFYLKMLYKQSQENQAIL
jgi:hypothetical protein